jgi:hypothetical protein
MKNKHLTLDSFRNIAVTSIVAASAFMAIVPTAHATVYDGTLYYTNYQGGGSNVLDITFNYDSSTQSLSYGTKTGLATVNGADGIMFAPNGNLLVTSNSVGSVYRIDPSTGAVLQTVSTGTGANYHMALDPTGTQFYSSNSYGGWGQTGPLGTFAINSNGSINNATLTTIVSSSGGLSNVTQLAFDPVTGRVFYTDGMPNANGSVGLFTFGIPNDTTTQLFSAFSITAAHGIIYDPFTGLMDMFGGGYVSTLDPTKATNSDIVGSLKTSGQFTCDFDQGAVDGYGHAFIAGCNEMTFLDYSISHDITHPDYVFVTTGFGNIDDIAPLVGLGAPPPTIPEPATVGLLGSGLLGLFATRRRKI